MFLIKHCFEKNTSKKIGHDSPKQDLMSQANPIYAKLPALFHPSKSRFVLAGNKELLQKRKLDKWKVSSLCNNVQYRLWENIQTFPQFFFENLQLN